MVIVRVTEGLLRGEERELVTADGTLFSFKGIPYAAPPLGNLRFKNPRPPKSWEGVRECLNHASVCPHLDIFTDKIIDGNEDCLYLNVYSPNLNPNKPAPVMVYIHGGGFKSGSGNSDRYGPDFLVQKGVVLVTINYRLEVLGFLCLDSKEVSGNAGLKDQSAALRWVKNNIAAFGGDSNNVTIFGESAGGASVTYHVISPMSKGLFNKAIAMSGTSLCEWAFTTEPARRARMLGRKLGAPDHVVVDSKLLLEYLQSVPYDKLIHVIVPICAQESHAHPTNSFFFGPVVEINFGDKQQFLTLNVDECLNKGIFNDVDIIFGYTSEESKIFAEIISKSPFVEDMDQHYEYMMTTALARKTNQELGMKLSDEIRKHYFGDKAITPDNVEDMVHHYSWRLFKYAILKFLQLYALKSKSKQFLYQFSCESERNITADLMGITCNVRGVSHVDDLLYIFDHPIYNLKLDKNGRSYCMIQQVCSLWTNFAKTGNPTPDASLGVTWSPYSEDKREYLDIGERLRPGTRLDQELFLFWEKIHQLAE